MLQDSRFGARGLLKQRSFIRLAALTFAFGSLQSAPAPDLVIRHVTVIDVAGMRTHDDQRVVVQGGRIIAVEPEQPVAPKASTVIDATGKFLIPGLWDMHSHLTYYPGPPKGEDVTEVVLPLFVANGVLGTRDMGAVDVARMVRLREEVDAGKRLGPRMVVSGPQHDGPIATDWTKRRVANAEEARQAVRAIKEAGADFIKVYDTLSPETYLAIAEESRRVGLPFAGHLPLAMTALEAVEAGPGSIEHMGGGKLRAECFGYLREGEAPPLDTDQRQTERVKDAINAIFAGKLVPGAWADGTLAWLNSDVGKSAMATLSRDIGTVESLIALRRRPITTGVELCVRARHTKGERNYKFHIDQSGQSEKIDWLPDEPDVLAPGRLQKLAESLIARRVWLTPTLTAQHGLAARSDLIKNSDPRLIYVHPEVRRQLDPRNNPSLRSLTDADWEFFKRGYAREASLAVLLHKAGVRLLAGTDAVTDYCLPGFALHDELALLVKAGLSPGEALRTATLNPAEFLGLEKDLGSIAIGKRADLVLLERNPLNDIHNTTSIWGVIRRGQYFTRVELDRMLETVRKRVNRD